MNNNKSYLTLRDAWEIFRRNVWLFVASMAIALVIAFGYIVVTPPQYKRTASILIKHNDSNKASVSASSAFENMGLVQSNTDINNEIYVLLTPALMEEVARRLSIDYRYSLKFRDLRWIDVYNASPFKVMVDSTLTNTNVSFYFNSDGGSTFILSEVNIDDVITHDEIAGEFDKPIKFGASEITLTKGAVIPEDISENLYRFYKTNIKEAAARYSSLLTVELKDKDASIIDLNIVVNSTQKGDDILNTLISVYNENWIKDKNTITLSTTNFINERLSIIERELGTVDKSISSYKSENLLPDVSAVTSMNLQSSSEILKRQIELNNQLSMAKYILQYINSESTGNEILPSNAGIESSSINSQIASYNELLIKKNALLINSSTNHPVIASLISELEAKKKGLILSVNDLITTLEIQISNTQQEEIATRQKISNNPNQELYLLSTGREQMIKEQLYLYLLQKREENQLNQAFTAYNTQVLSYSRGSGTPISPQRNTIYLLAFILGIAAPVIYLIVRANLNVTVKSKEDLKGLTVPLVGSIPLVRNRSRKAVTLDEIKSVVSKSKGEENENRIVVSSGGRDFVNEAFRVLRTNLDFVTLQTNKCKVINVTSFHPKSGKSFVVINLAMSLATKNSRVLAIDGDLRRGTLSISAGSPKLGYVSYLNGKVDDVEDLVVKAEHHPMLDILPMGVMPPNPTELILGERFEKLIQKFSESYDYILFDCPPIDIVPDATIIEKYCDTTLFVIRAGMVDKRDLPDLQTLYDSKRIRNMSLILNSIDYKKNRKYGYGSYGYGYGYGGYGYGGYGSKRK